MDLSNRPFKPKRTTIRTLAEEIRRRWPDLSIEVIRGYCNTDRHYGRVRWPGKGRTGTRIIVREKDVFTDDGFFLRLGKLLLDHNNAETYRRTEDVQRWMADYAKLRTEKTRKRR